MGPLAIQLVGSNGGVKLRGFCPRRLHRQGPTTRRSVLATGCLQLMGHRDPRSVEKYAKLDGSAIRAALERLHERGRDIALSPALGFFAGP